MADLEHREIFIIKRHISHDEAHHGGAWKIAFADFMTAMMALFLVLWLISSTSEKTKHTVAQYFNPVKLVDMTTLKKGFRDPKDTEMGSGPNVKESPEESKSSRRNPSKAKEDVNCQDGPDSPAQTEAALFRDPYAVLAEISASAAAQGSKSSSGVAKVPATDGPPGTFSDPFTTTPHEEETPPDALLNSAQGGQGQDQKDTEGKDTQNKETQDKDTHMQEAADAQAPRMIAEKTAPSQAPALQNQIPGVDGPQAGRNPEAAPERQRRPN